MPIPNISVPLHKAMHVVLTTSSATAPNTGAAGAANTGDSLTTRNYKDPVIATMWSSRQTSGFSQVAFPTGHDTTRGYRAQIAASTTELTLPIGMQIPLTPQELITNTISGSATAGDVELDSWLIRYADDQGQHWMPYEQVRSRMREMTTVSANITGAAGPQYGGTELINADSDLLIANRDYAVLGMSCSARIHAMGFVGPDTGNDRIAVPGNLRTDLTANFFRNIFGACPVINSGNRASTNLFTVTDENVLNPNITLYLALLA